MPGHQSGEQRRDRKSACGNLSVGRRSCPPFEIDRNGAQITWKKVNPCLRYCPLNRMIWVETKNSPDDKRLCLRIDFIGVQLFNERESVPAGVGRMT